MDTKILQSLNTQQSLQGENRVNSVQIEEYLKIKKKQQNNSEYVWNNGTQPKDNSILKEKRIVDERQLLLKNEEMFETELEEESKIDVFKNKEFNKQEYEKKYEDQLSALQKKSQQHHFLVLGDMGHGKSSFIKKITQNPNIQTSDGKKPHTLSCQMFKKEDKNYIDTPGINSNDQNRFQVLLEIVKFIKNQKLIINDLFILQIQNDKLKSLNQLRQFSYTYFLYELFGDQIEHQQVEQLNKEYFQSSYLLNWSEARLNDKDDNLQNKRKLIFNNKNKAANYFEYLYSYHIRILTFFDENSEEHLQDFDDKKTEFLKEQIWSNRNQEDIFEQYNDYIKDQEKHLLKKIEKIQKLEFQNKSNELKKDIQNIVLIGKSQVGKSSLIDQLANQKGLIGNEEQSKTQSCITYRVDYGNTIYRFIDTPVYKGTENAQDDYDTFKIIADYLYRNEIKDFKLLFMINKSKEKREFIFELLDKFFQFIADIFDQDVSFLDREFLNNLQSCKNESRISKILLKDKILQIFSQDKNNNDHDYSDEFLQFTIFKSNYWTTDHRLIKVPQEQDKKQKEQLFEKINKIDSITLDDKVNFRINKSILENIISSTQTFSHQFNIIAEKYENLSNINQIISIILNTKQNTSNLNELNNKRKLIIQDLRQFQYNVLFSVYQNISNHVKNLKFSDQAKNNALKHFLPIQQNPILFEITDENSESTLISKKQHHYSTLAHQLSVFADLNNKEHQIKIENLAEIDLSKDLCFQQIEQSRAIEQNYQKQPEENIQKIQQISTFLNIINQKGIQSHKQQVYYSLAINSLQILPVITTKIALELFLLPLRFGYDACQLYNGIICREKYNITRATRIIGLSLIYFSLLPAIGWMVGVAGGLVTLAGYLYSSFLYSSKQSFDSTIGMCFKQIMNETSPNQSLKYYEMAQLLNKKFNLTNYSQLKDNKIGYDMYRQLEKYNSKTENFLIQLFQTRGTQKLKDVISKFIVENYILSQISQHFEFLQQNEEKNIDYLNRCIQELSKIEILIKTFYYKSKYYKICEEPINLMKHKLGEQKNKSQGKVQFRQQEIQKLKNFETQKNNLIKEYSKEITYQKQINLADRTFRFDNSFKILFNSFCNLTYLKAEQKLKQPIIRQIQKDTISMKFNVVKNCQLKNNSFILNCEDDSKLAELINYMKIVNNYRQNRYLNQVQENDDPNLTSLSQNEIMDTQVQYSIDLHPLAMCSLQETDFIGKVEKELRIKLNELFKVNNKVNSVQQCHLENEIEKRVEVLYQNQFNYRMRAFYKSVYILKEYFRT
ncbi:hypothetical protein ABPG74_019951 [Tetrahymena malaccensis]